MICVKLLAALALLPVLAPAAGFCGSGQEKQAPAQSSQETKAEPTGDGTEGQIGPDLQGIESFRVQMERVWPGDGASKDESTALIVNPFSVRKRGRTYGSIYEYHRNDNFDARNFFDPVGKPLPEFKRNQFGISLGTSISSKFKIFGSFDGLRIVKGATNLSLVPTPEMKRGDFSALTWAKLVNPFTGISFKDNHIPEELINPVAAKLLSLFPDPNRNDDPWRNYVNNQPVINNNNNISTRIDYEFSPKTKVFGKYSISDGNQELISTLPTFGTTMDERSQEVSIDLTHSFTSNKVLNLTFGLNRSASLQLSKLSHQKGLLASLGIEGVNVLESMDEGYPQLDILGYANVGFGTGFGAFPGTGFAGGSPEKWVRNYYSIKSNFAYIRGNHNLAIAGNLNLSQLNGMRTSGMRRGQFGFSGQFTGDAFADFLMGIPYTATHGIGSDRSDLRQRSWRLSVKDDWKINRNFTLSMSLAYSLMPFYSSHNNRVSFVYPLVFEPPANSEVVTSGSPRARDLGLNLKPGQSAYTDKNDWEPTLGLAYSPLGNNRLVLRTSYKITHDSMSPIQGLIYVGRNYPFYYLQGAGSPTLPILNLSRPFASGAETASTFKAADPYLRNPYAQQWSTTVQYEFLHGWSLELAYNGQKSTHVFRAVPSNVPLPGAGPIQSRRPNPAFGEIDVLSSSASYSENGLDVAVKRRLTGAFSIQAEYKWSRALTDCWGWGFINPNNPRNLAAERSLYGFSNTTNFNLDYILDLPIGRDKLISTRWAGKFAQVFEGWRISGITSIMGGFPFNPEIFGDPNNDGVWGDRPNRIGPGTLPKSKRSINKWFETSDFVAPDVSGPNPQWFGNSGRNILMTPGSTTWDISILKRTRITKDGNMLEFRTQFFNAFNHVNFQQPNNFLNTPTFGVISGADPSREIEVALKYTF